jgi:hypothetical protein
MVPSAQSLLAMASTVRRSVRPSVGTELVSVQAWLSVRASQQGAGYSGSSIGRQSGLIWRCLLRRFPTIFPSPSLRHLIQPFSIDAYTIFCIHLGL